MSYASSIPTALPNLVAMLQAAPGLAGVEVTDGPPTEDPQVLEAVCVGWSPSEDIDAVEAADERGDLASARQFENYTVHCSVNVLNGDRDLPAARVRAYQLFGFVGQVLADDQTLRGAVMQAGIRDHNLRQEDTNAGMLARVNFGIAVRASTRR